MARSELKKISDSMRPPVRVGVLGLGRIAINRYIPSLLSMPDLFTVTAACDTLKERRDIVEKMYPKARLFRFAQDIIDDPEIDVLLVTVNSTDHFEAARLALAKHFYVLMESPMASNADQMKILKNAPRASERFLPCVPAMFDVDFRLALQMVEDKRLGELYSIKINKEEWVRRDDWQSVKRCMGGAAWTRGPEAVMQMLALLPIPPVQLWSDLKRIVALGDAEDYAHLAFKTRGDITAEVEINGGSVDRRRPSFEIRGSKGVFTVMPGKSEGKLYFIDPSQKFPRKRSSVKVPPLVEESENPRFLEETVSLPAKAEKNADVAFWKVVHNTVMTGAPFPISFEHAADTVRYLQIAKQASSFAK